MYKPQQVCNNNTTLHGVKIITTDIFADDDERSVDVLKMSIDVLLRNVLRVYRNVQRERL